MDIVVTGATGNVGTSLVQALTDDVAVDRVVGLARRPPAWSPPRVHWVQADVSRDRLVEHFRGADVIVHLAWLFQPSRRPAVTYATNVRGSRRVFEAVARAGVPSLVYASSVGTYAPGPGRRPVDESWPATGFRPATYSREKAEVERFLDVFEGRHPEVRVVRLRPGFIFKAESASQQRRLFAGPLLPGRLVGGRHVPILPVPPSLRFQVLHSTDAARAYQLAATGDARGAYNVAADPVLGPELIGEVFRARTVELPPWVFRAAVAALWRVHAIPTQPALFDLLLRSPVMDTSRARDELGWTPEHRSEEALEAFLRGLREGSDLATPPLDSRTGGLLRRREFATGVGGRP